MRAAPGRSECGTGGALSRHAGLTGRAVSRTTDDDGAVEPGTHEPSRLYVVAAFVPRRTAVVVGSLGCRTLERGWQAYVGSARRGRGARVARHMRAAKPLRWHADFVFSRAPATRAWLIDAPAGAGLDECSLAAALSEVAAAATPAGTARQAGGFGAGDCGCAGHLVRFPSLASLAEAVAAVTARLGGRVSAEVWRTAARG